MQGHLERRIFRKTRNCSPPSRSPILPQKERLRGFDTAVDGDRPIRTATHGCVIATNFGNRVAFLGTPLFNSMRAGLFAQSEAGFFVR